MSDDIDLTIPDELSDAAQCIWKMLHANFGLEGDHDVLLRVALQQWDRAQEARELIDREGAVLTLPNGYRQIHPAVKVEGLALGVFLKGWKALGFDLENVGDVGRPPG